MDKQTLLKAAFACFVVAPSACTDARPKQAEHDKHAHAGAPEPADASFPEAGSGGSTPFGGAGGEIVCG